MIGTNQKLLLRYHNLAIELNCNVILMDDLLARHAAERKGLVPLGVLGVLKVAYKFKILTRNEVRQRLSNYRGIMAAYSTIC